MSFQDVVELRRRYTGETAAGAAQEIRRLARTSAIIPAAEGIQQRLESEVMRCLLDYPSTYTTRPLRVERVVPRPDTLIVRFAADNDPDGLTDQLAWGLFPTGGRDDMRGVPGLRLQTAAHDRLDVMLLGTSARIRLEGVPTRSWREIERVRSARARASNEPLAMRHPTLTPNESAYLNEHAKYISHGHSAAPLGSALLRRLMIFRSAAHWHDMAGYHKHSTTFAFRMTFTRASIEPHQALLQALSDPRCGIPLTLRTDACHCQWGYDECRLYLEADGCGDGRVELQFHTISDCHIPAAVEVLRFSGSPCAHIVQYLPPPTTASRCDHPADYHGGTIRFLQKLARGRRVERESVQDPVDGSYAGSADS
ncbi:hypothetical protein [Streptacidiphilus albus]|uniref:hypothetical protein n=1 Tax=Streptacidiphilus albus TaxID=105425 RepID=UPI00054C66DB|nr:hypothetical protein [Streptacidiphilus albus]